MTDRMVVILAFMFILWLVLGYCAPRTQPPNHVGEHRHDLGWAY